jgi:hypothetical protein
MISTNPFREWLDIMTLSLMVFRSVPEGIGKGVECVCQSPM